MRTLANEPDKNALLTRLRRLTPDSQRRWGKMTPHQMICHLNDAFKTGTGEREVTSVSSFASRTIIKWIALYSPLPWPHGIGSPPEVDQQRGGTPPVEFNRDRQELESMIERLSSRNRDFQWHRHPFFDEMSERDWMRWAYLHCDHHLRQFGV